MGKHIPHERPIAVYNTEKKELIGVFATPNICQIYLYGKADTLKYRKVYYALGSKSKVNGTIFDFPVALRYSNDEQLEIIGDQDFVIIDGYPIPSAFSLKGFTDTRSSLAKSALVRTNRYWLEKKSSE